jgi:hypothetical protein
LVFAESEGGQALGADRYLLPCLRVAGGVGLVPFDSKGAEASDLDSVVLGKGFGHLAEEDFSLFFGLGAGQALGFLEPVYQILLVYMGLTCLLGLSIEFHALVFRLLRF